MSRTEPILAWRAWRLRIDPETYTVRPVLESCVYGERWPEREPFAAACPEHELPEPGCGCGIYAVKTKRAALEKSLASMRIVRNMPPCVSGSTFDWPRVVFGTPGDAGIAVAVALQNATCTFTVEEPPPPAPAPIVGAVRSIELTTDRGSRNKWTKRSPGKAATASSAT